MASAEFASPAVSDALVILGAAGLVIPVFTRFRVTPIIGFILIGILVGPYGLGRLSEKTGRARNVVPHDWRKKHARYRSGWCSKHPAKRNGCEQTRNGGLPGGARV